MTPECAASSCELALDSFRDLVDIAEKVDGFLSPIAYDEWQGMAAIKRGQKDLRLELNKVVKTFRPMGYFPELTEDDNPDQTPQTTNHLAHAIAQVIRAYDEAIELGKNNTNISEIQGEAENVVQEFLVPFFNTIEVD